MGWGNYVTHSNGCNFRCDIYDSCGVFVWPTQMGEILGAITMWPSQIGRMMGVILVNWVG